MNKSYVLLVIALPSGHSELTLRAVNDYKAIDAINRNHPHGVALARWLGDNYGGPCTTLGRISV